jgi:hypothetical protein
VECAGQIQPAVLDAIDRSEALVTERIAGKFLDAARAPIVIEFGIRLKERRPGFPVTVLQCFDGGLDGWIRERIDFHWIVLLSLAPVTTITFFMTYLLFGDWLSPKKNRI